MFWDHNDEKVIIGEKHGLSPVPTDRSVGTPGDTPPESMGGGMPDGAPGL